MIKRSKTYSTAEELYLDNEKIIFKYITSYIVKNHLTEYDRDELVSQVWCKVSDKLDVLLTMDVPAVCTYIKSIANSVVIDDYRARTKARVKIEYMDPKEIDRVAAKTAKSVEDIVFDIDLEAYIKNALVLLNAEERRLLQFYYCKGMTAKKLGELMGLTEGAVKKKLQEICREEVRKGEGYLD